MSNDRNMRARFKLCTVPMSPLVLYKIGLALENGQLEPQMRETWGDETIDWLNHAIQSPEFMAAYPPAGSEDQE